MTWGLNVELFMWQVLVKPEKSNYSLKKLRALAGCIFHLIYFLAKWFYTPMKKVVLINNEDITKYSMSLIVALKPKYSVDLIFSRILREIWELARNLRMNRTAICMEFSKWNGLSWKLEVTKHLCSLVCRHIRIFGHFRLRNLIR